jgi:hypothetical protein
MGAIAVALTCMLVAADAEGDSPPSAAARALPPQQPAAASTTTRPKQQPAPTAKAAGQRISPTAPRVTAARGPARDEQDSEDASERPQSIGRDEFFQPPASRPPATKRDEALQVALKGFIETDKLRALLAVSGELRMLATGEQLAGVHVVQISPPTVTLQRGRIRWNESLFPQR